MQGLIPAVLAALLTLGNAQATEKTVPPPETVDKLAWLAGCWNVDGAEPGSGEHWSTAAGGTLLGTSRTVKGGKTTAFEFVQIRLGLGGEDGHSSLSEYRAGINALVNDVHRDPSLRFPRGERIAHRVSAGE